MKHEATGDAVVFLEGKIASVEGEIAQECARTTETTSGDIGERHVGALLNGKVKMHVHCGDGRMWLLTGGGPSGYTLTNATTDLVLSGSKAAPIAAPGRQARPITLASPRST